MQHHIHRQRWQVKAPSQQVAFALRQQLRSHLDAALLPVFERAFDALATDDEVVRIPQLTLDIKLNGAESNFIGALTEALPDALRLSLNEMMQGAALPHPTHKLQRLSAPDRLRNTLLNYLSSGLLEWHERGGIDESTLLQMLREEAASLAGDATALRNALDDTSGSSLTQRQAASFRLLQLLPAESRLALLTLMPRHADLPENHKQTSMLLVVLNQLASTSFLALPLDSHLRLRVQAMLLAIRDEDLSRPMDSQLAGLLRDCQRQAAALTDSDSVQMRVAIESLLKSIPADVRQTTVVNTAPAQSVRPLPQAEAMPDTGYLANDAGLILLHPFLPRLFEVTGIAPGGILPEAMLPRAAALLHWLVKGREEFHEYELTTIKILLGLAPESTLLVGGGLLDESERAEAEALLAAVISHWNVLGKTGVNTLRESFLQRRGLLRDTDAGWQLQVETEPYDLLLGRLPWSISIVRLPWMSRPIFTEWHTP